MLDGYQEFTLNNHLTILILEEKLNSIYLKEMLLLKLGADLKMMEPDFKL